MSCALWTATWYLIPGPGHEYIETDYVVEHMYVRTTNACSNHFATATSETTCSMLAHTFHAKSVCTQL